MNSETTPGVLVNTHGTGEFSGTVLPRTAEPQWGKAEPSGACWSPPGTELAVQCPSDASGQDVQVPGQKTTLMDVGSLVTLG